MSNRLTAEIKAFGAWCAQPPASSLARDDAQQATAYARNLHKAPRLLLVLILAISNRHIATAGDDRFSTCHVIAQYGSLKHL